jgi:hypothetical protein
VTRPNAILRHGVNTNRRRVTASTLIGDWKADTLGLANGASVTSWPDSTATQGAFTATGTALVYQTAARNGLAAIAVAANNGASMALASNIAQPFTLLAALKLNSAAQTGTIISLGTTNSLQLFLTGTGYDMNNGTDMVRGTPDTTFHVLAMHFNGASSLMRIDGVQAGAVGNPGSNGMTSGAKSGAIAGQSGGYLLGQLSLYTGPFPTAAETALRTKWATA